MHLEASLHACLFLVAEQETQDGLLVHVDFLGVLGHNLLELEQLHGLPVRQFLAGRTVVVLLCLLVLGLHLGLGHSLLQLGSPVLRELVLLMHAAQQLVDSLLGRLHLGEAQIDLDVAEHAYNGLEFGVVYSSLRFDDA